MCGLGDDDRAAQIGGNVALRPAGGDAIAEDTTDDAPHPAGAFIAAGRFQHAQHGEDFLNLDLVQGALANQWIGHVEQPAHLFERDRGPALALDLEQPFFRDGLEGLAGVNFGAHAGELLLRVRVEAFLDLFAGLVPFVAGVGKAHVRPYVEGQGFHLAKIAIIHPPVFSALGRDQQIERAFVVKLVGFIAGAGIFDRNGRQRHEGISIRNRVAHAFQIPPQ